ncbi:MAG TPA: bifunctional diguanylate cyclase/phosphodiesterase [Caulobacteraceae bacterium]|nr:bifunctional diguanylate cyclase/phosphodiesterase [Caulobacteraceae bacterium]
MSGRALFDLEAPAVESSRAPPSETSTRLLVTIVNPTPEAAVELAAFVRDALPGENVVAAPRAAEALVQAQAADRAGHAPGVFIFDFRGRTVGDLAGQVRQVRKGYPRAELVVIADPASTAAFAACVQVTGTPETLTFLLAPLHALEAVRTFRAVVERYRTTSAASTALSERERAIEQLETEARELKARLDIALHAARHDGLTGILNRAGFVDELAARLTRRAQRQTVFLIDLDRFKSVNDTLGHDAGDDLVRKICAAMSAIVSAGDVLARLGGDEFGIIVEGMTDVGVDEFCGLILRVCAQSRRVFGHEVQVSASIGVAHQGENPSQGELMRKADLALYAAKREGRNRFRIYDTAIDKAAKHRLRIESGLERAMNTSQLTMAYQPIVKADTGAIQGFEALIRWNSPEHGAISPADFVPVAEETGLILQLGDWITRQALKDCRRWGGPYVSVNLSARQFLRHNVAERILQYAADADLPPDRIQIELTETAIIDDVERADQNLNILRSAGVRVALDDFGTGYSSLVYLNQFAIDCIKIDKSFVDNITRDRQSAVIVASVAKLAASLGMSVVAEGVETDDQRHALIVAGCGALQGYHFGKPMSTQEVTQLLAGAADPVQPPTEQTASRFLATAYDGR